MFPIGDIPKPEVRRLAHEADLPSADKKDSQGICFVGKVDLPTFLQQKLKSVEGDIIEVFDPYYQNNQHYGTIRTILEQIRRESDTTDHTLISDYIGDIKNLKVNDPLREHWVEGNPENEGGCSTPDSAFDREKIAQLTDEQLLTLSTPVEYNIEFETETYRSGKKRIKKTRYKENPYGKILGKHDGAQFYTIGQRKGLNIGGHKDSVFVIETDVEKNLIYVGEGHSHKGLSRSCLRISPEEVHWIRQDQILQPGQMRRCRVRIRYRQPLQDALLIMRENGLYILFDKPQRGITPGQFAVWYDCDEMLGSGVILK
jgi:tRNA-specific 2-thiouridylase